MYEVTRRGGSLYDGELLDTPTDALWKAVIDCSRTGEDLAVTGPGGLTGPPGVVLFDIEADTKVDESDPYYPVIVHRR